MPSLRARAQSSATGFKVPSELPTCAPLRTIFTCACQERIEPAQVQQSFVPGDRKIGNPGAGLLGQYLPRNKIAVVFHFGEQDDIAGFKVFSAPGGGNEINAFGGAAGENDLIGVARVDEFGRPGAGGFKGNRGAVAQFMNAPMNVGVVVLVIMHQRVDDGAGLLRGGGVIKINQRLAMDILVQNPEILSQG